MLRFDNWSDPETDTPGLHHQTKAETLVQSMETAPPSWLRSSSQPSVSRLRARTT